MSAQTVAWGDVEKDIRHNSSGGGDLRFISLKDGDTVTIRILDHQGATKHHVHKISQPVNGEDVFRSIPATPRIDDDYVIQNSPEHSADTVSTRYATRCVVYGEDGEPEAIKILEGGPMIFKPLDRLAAKHGPPTEYDVEISRYGEGLKTEYEVHASPNSNDIDLEEWIDEIDSNPEWDWENIFPEVTAEEQQAMIEEAGFDIEWDPVAELVESMDYDEAMDERISFGKYGPEHFKDGKTVRDVMGIDTDYLRWIAQQDGFSNHRIKAAAIIALNGTDALERNKPQKKVTKGKKKSTKTKKTTETTKEQEDTTEDAGEAPTRDDWPLKSSIEKYLARWYDNDGGKVDLALKILEGEGLEWDPNAGEVVEIGGASEPEDEEEPDEETGPDGMTRDELISNISEIFATNDRFRQDAMEIVNVVKEHGGGKTRLKDLKVDQLQSLYDEVS